MGAAGEAGEMEKDERHELDVLSVGGMFFPLIVETLGLWTQSSLKAIIHEATCCSNMVWGNKLLQVLGATYPSYTREHVANVCPLT